MLLTSLYSAEFGSHRWRSSCCNEATGSREAALHELSPRMEENFKLSLGTAFHIFSNLYK
uniref:Uncharacterized protein n=1 Tax=Megaselia scalaris TaxID=36166 RepID=T1GVD7_MEGSC